MTDGRFLTEAMGRCWHEEDEDFERFYLGRLNNHSACCKCGLPFLYEELSFTDWPGYGRLMEWSRQQVWWDDFYASVFLPGLAKELGKTAQGQSLLEPAGFAPAIETYLRSRGQQA